MKNKTEIEIGTDGTIRTIYQQGIEEFAKDIGASKISSGRASHVEWEDTAQGWTVRSAKDTEIAIRESGELSKEGAIKAFPTREVALEAEERLFWKLLDN